LSGLLNLRSAYIAFIIDPVFVSACPHSYKLLTYLFSSCYALILHWSIILAIASQASPTPSFHNQALQEKELDILRKQYVQNQLAKLSNEHISEKVALAQKQFDATVNQEMAIAKQKWWATPGILKGPGTKLLALVASPVKSASLKAILTLPVLGLLSSQEVRANSSLARSLKVAPALVGILSFLSQRKTNDKAEFWIRELGSVRATWGNVQHHPITQKQADRDALITSSRVKGFEAAMLQQPSQPQRQAEILFPLAHRSLS
jgi:hypothetical protein